MRALLRFIENAIKPHFTQACGCEFKRGVQVAECSFHQFLRKQFEASNLDLQRKVCNLDDALRNLGVMHSGRICFCVARCGLPEMRHAEITHSHQCDRAVFVLTGGVVRA